MITSGCTTRESKKYLKDRYLKFNQIFRIQYYSDQNGTLNANCHRQNHVELSEGILSTLKYSYIGVQAKNLGTI